MTPTTDHLPANFLNPVARVPLGVLETINISAAAYPNSALHVDCRTLPYPHTLGVCHQVSQLLALRHTGFSISLYRANPVLRRCLQLLQVAHLFAWVA